MFLGCIVTSNDRLFEVRAEFVLLVYIDLIEDKLHAIPLLTTKYFAGIFGVSFILIPLSFN